MDLNQELTSGQNSENSVPEEKPETVHNPDAVLAKNRELLNEKKALASKVQEFENRFREIETQKLEAEGRKDEVISALREQLRETSEKLSKKEKTYNWNTVSSQIKEAARAKGCVNPDKLMRLMSEDDLGSIEVYEDFSINQDDLARVLDKAVKEHSDIGIFGTRVKVDDKAPVNTFIDKPKDASEMSKEEIRQQLLNS